MEPKIGKKTTMHDVAALSWRAARALVRKEERSTGERMVAYDNIARAVGVSSEWLRKYIAKKEGKEPRVTAGFNLMVLYSRVCDRVEQASENERMLKEEIDAAIESITFLASREARADRGAEAIARADQ